MSVPPIGFAVAIQNQGHKAKKMPASRRANVRRELCHAQTPTTTSKFSIALRLNRLRYQATLVADQMITIPEDWSLAAATLRLVHILISS